MLVAFLKVASVEKDGFKFLTKEDFGQLVLKNVSQVDLDKSSLDQGVTLVSSTLLLLHLLLLLI